MAENPNENCLAGCQCPKCGSYGGFQLMAKVLLRVTDDGTEELGGDNEFEDGAWAKCEECGYAGVWVEFRGGGAPKPETELKETFRVDERRRGAAPQIEELLESSVLTSGEIASILDVVDRRCERITASFGRMDVSDECGHALTDEEWRAFKATSVWTGGLFRGMIAAGFAAVGSGLGEAGLKGIQRIP